jgi:hypothetical protein
MNNYTKEDIIRLVEEEDVEFIRLQFTDLFGNLKNIAVTASQLDRVLSNKCMFDGSAIDGFARIEESDMYLHPDLSTLEIFPWRPQQGKVARMICDVYRPNGQPFEGDPRYVLKRAVQQAEDMGYTFEVGPECEFFLFNTDENTMPTTNTHEQAGYFDIGPLDFGENARRDIVMNLEDMGFVIEASHHEMAPAQHEIDFRYDEALHTADNIMTFKMAVRTIARRHGLHATFMPKPKFGVNGSWYYNSLEDFVADRPYKYTYKYTDPDLTGGNTKWAPAMKSGQFGFYAQDKWDINNNFNLTYGLRIDIPVIFNNPTTNDAFNQFAESQNLNARVGQNPSAKVLFSPRVGFRWYTNDSHNTLLRGGIGIFTGRVPFVWLSNAFNNTEFIQN